MSSNVACCYYPTTVVFVDDNQSFLDNIILSMSTSINVVSFTEPTKAIEYLNMHAISSFTQKYFKSLKENDDDAKDFGFNVSNVEHGYIDIDLFKIHREIYNADRFNNSIVVVVDYTMPEMNGMELCKFLQHLPIKFILITGDATLNNAIEAFNQGLIHQFIPKSSNNFTDRLQSAIFSLQEKQFEESSSAIIKSLSATSIFLNDLSLTSFIKDFFKKNEIIEYYLINRSGGFLTLKADGYISWLVIKSEDEMIEYENVAKDNYGDSRIIEDLHSRKKLLFLTTEEEHINVSVEDWGQYLYPATKINGDNGSYYYANIPQLDLSRGWSPVDRIISYNEFLRQL